MKKRGSHIGIGLSFALFIITLVYLIAILIPAIERSGDKQYLLEDLKDNLLKKTYDAVSVSSLYVGEVNPNKDCISIQNAQGLLIANFSIKDENKNIRDYSIQGNSLLIDVGYNFNGYLKFYYSSSFNSSGENNLNGCHPITDYSLEPIRTKDYSSEEKIFSLISQYENNYENLKENLEVPEETEFSFAFTFGNGTTIEIGNVSFSEDIYIDEDIVQYINSYGGVNIGFITVKVW